MDKILKKSDYVVFWGTCLIYMFLGLILLSAVAPIKPIRSKYLTNGVISYFYQTRWNVYVKSVDEPMYHLYKIENNKAVLWDLRPFVSQYWFGLKRNNKTIAQEVLTITSDTAMMATFRTYPVSLPASKDIDDYIANDTLKFNDAPHKNSVLLKGRYLLVKEDAVSWERAKLKPAPERKLIVIPVNVSRQ